MNTLRKKQADMKVTMLGELRIQSETGLVVSTVNRSHKMWGLLCYLILNRYRSIPQAELIQVFWPQEELVNPLGALKTLLYRLRPLLKPLTAQGVSLIVSQRGSYSWNPQVTCQVDLEHYLQQCERIRGADLTEQEQIYRCRNAIAVYKGRLLPELRRYSWIKEQSDASHQMYVEMVKTLCVLLERHGHPEEMYEVCSRAAEVDQLQELFHLYQIQALLKLGHDAAALEHYQRAEELLFQNLGVSPSEELRGLYTEIKRAEQGIESDLGDIQKNLQETAVQNGAFVCDYGFFRETYRLEVRRSVRNAVRIQLALLTVVLPFETEAERKELDLVMERLLGSLQQGLRNGDVISQYSAAQYVVMLPGAGLEDSNTVMERVLAAHRRKYRYNCPKISCHIRELKGEETLAF